MEHEIGWLIKTAIEYGVPLNTVMLILFLPIVVTVITFFRQIVGIKAFGIYTPAMITFAFLIIGMQSGSLLNGVKYGVTMFVMVIAVGTLSRVFMKRFRLLYLPRMAIVITMVAFITLGVLMISGYYHRTGLANVSIFPILIMITLVEKFVSTQIEKGSRIAIILSVETLAISLIAYFIIGLPSLGLFVQKYPLAVLLTVIVNVFLGRWSGLRVTEYFRFNNLISK